MNQLEQLRKCRSLHDLANLLGFTPKLLGFILYKNPIHTQYDIFEIDKKNGGKRLIIAPKDDLKKYNKV